jgi:hypothetical protein
MSAGRLMALAFFVPIFTFGHQTKMVIAIDACIPTLPVLGGAELFSRRVPAIVWRGVGINGKGV